MPTTNSQLECTESRPSSAMGDGGGGDKRLDFDAPFLSVRRFSAAPLPASTAPPPPRPKRSPLPFYKSDLKSGPIRNPGVVPFVWEHSPGHPKSITPNNNIIEPDENNSDDDDDAFTDAVDTLSRTESFFMNCSISGVEDDAAEPPPRHSGSFATDPQVRDFMMGRFLPAAQAAAVGSPQCATRKPARPPVEREGGGDYRQLAAPPQLLKHPYGRNFASRIDRGEDEEDGDDYDGGDIGDLPGKACGLLPRFWLKNSFCLLNPVPGMKARSRLPPPPGRRVSVPQQLQPRATLGSLAQLEDENSWEAVYKHKSGNGILPHQGEDGSRIHSESNHLVYWSDSQTADGSSPHRHSAGGVSPYRNEAPRSQFHEGKSFLGVPKRERKVIRSNGSDSFEKYSEDSSEVAHRDGSRQGSGAMSPAVERTLCVDSVCLTETRHSKSSSGASSTEIKGMLQTTNKDSEVGVVSHKMKDSLIPEMCDRDTLQPNASVISSYTNGFKHNENSVSPQTSKSKDEEKTDAGFLPSLLPPLLPTSPSESWLRRTLPSVSSKNPPKQSFLGIQSQCRKQALPATSSDQKRETNEKPKKIHRQLRFADMLTKPLSPESEI